MFKTNLNSINLIHLAKVTVNSNKMKITYTWDGKIETETFANSTEYSDAVDSIVAAGFLLIGDTYYNKDRLSIVSPNGKNITFNFIGGIVINKSFNDAADVEALVAEIESGFIKINGKWYQGKQIHVAKLDPITLTIVYDFLGMDEFPVTYDNQTDYNAAVDKLAEIDEGGGGSTKVATPKFSPSAGGVTSGTLVSITCSTQGATIHYTTDGTTPTSASTTYSEAISVTEEVTIKAIAVKEGLTDSSVASASYTIVLPKVATPTFEPAAGEVVSGTTVAISCSTASSTIYYTTDGTTPTTESTAYTDPIEVTAAVTIKAIGVADGYDNSPVATAAYTIGIPTAAAPTFDPVAGEVVSGTTVALASTTPGAVIHYTTNNSTPTASSPTYSTPIAITEATTIKAITIADGYKNSTVSSASYTIQTQTLYYYSGLYNAPDEQHDEMPDPITKEFLEQLAGVTKAVATGKELTDSNISGDDDSGLTRYVYAYPKSYGTLSTYQTIGGVEAPIDSGFTHVEATIDGVAYWVYYLTDSVDTGNAGIIYK